jgi:hypothetical protein
MMDAEEYREVCRKFQAAIQAELREIFVELERLGQDQPAAKLRPLAISPEKHFGSAGDWEEGIFDAEKELSGIADFPQELRLRLKQVLKAINPLIDGNNSPSPQ